MLPIHRPKTVYSGLSSLPSGRASDRIVEGCLILEGGGWKGLYTLGVIDAMMTHGVNLRSCVGISAGGLAGLTYLSGQIGWSVRIDLQYRHDPEYCGLGALRRDHGITGFSYLFHDIARDYPLDMKRLRDPARRLAVGATNLLTGEIEYFEKGKCDIFQACRASATVPFASRPVTIGGVPYLDGGCAEKIPLSWEGAREAEKKVVVLTREVEFRRKPGLPKAAKRLYRRYPNFVATMERVNGEFNDTVDELERQAAAGEILLLAPSEPVTVSRFDGDMEKLGALYWLGWNDTQARMPALLEYLGVEDEAAEK
jgi:predicted patatin/cPLA2 family phospholipase